MFAAFDRVWPLVGLALTLVAIVWWMTLLGHLAIKFYDRIILAFSGISRVRSKSHLLHSYNHETIRL